MKKMHLILALLIFLLASCSEEDMPSVRSSKQTIDKIYLYFYNNEGSVKIHQLKNEPNGKSWAAAVKSGSRPCEVFSEITGMPATASDQYSYSYTSPDGSCFVSIKGTAEPNSKAVYAILRISVPQCPEIEEVYITTEEFFNGENTVSNSKQEDVPVIL